MNAHKSVKKYRLIVGIDRSDKTLSITTLASKGKQEQSEIRTLPGDLKQWWQQLRKEHRGSIAVAFEQPAINLLNFFEDKGVDVYGLNPSSTWGYRQSLKVSRAHTDESDSRVIALFVSTHQEQLNRYEYGSHMARKLKGYCVARRRAVDQRTRLTNRLQDLLKRYYPDVISLMCPGIYRDINMDLLIKWPTPQSILAASDKQLLSFFHAHGSRSLNRMKIRLEIIRSIELLTKDNSLVEPVKDEVLCICEQVLLLNRQVKAYDGKINDLIKSQEHSHLFETLPGAGPALAPRIYSAFALYADQCETAGDMACLVGMAPVTEQSGNMHRVYRRLRCDHFLRQSFHEWAKESWKFSLWAKAYVKHRQEQGKPFNTIMRSLAVKWIRILYVLWQRKEPYDESKYINNLIRRDHFLATQLKIMMQT